MALLDKVRQTLSNIGQKIDRNPTRTGVQLLPPVSFKKLNIQPVTKAIQSYQARPSNQIAKTIGSAFRPALEATGTFGNLAYQSIFNQPKLNRQMALDTQKALDASNRALQAAKAAREAGRPDLAAQYTRSMIPQLQAQSNKFTQSAKEAEAKRNALISSGVRTALYTSAAARLPSSIGAGAVGAGLNAAFGGQTSPDQIARSFGESFKYGGFPNLAFKGGLLARSLAGGAQNLAEDVAYAKLVEGRNLTPREAIISAATPGAFEAIGQFSRQVRKSMPKEVVEKVDPSGLMYNKAGQLFDPINGRWAKNTKEARLAAKNTKDFIASGGVPVKAGTRLVEMSDGKWVDESLIDQYKSEIDTPKLSVEPTGGKNLIAKARNQGGIGDINDVKARLLNVFTFSESDKLAIRNAQTPEELAPYLRKLNDGSLAKFFNSGTGTVEHPNLSKPLSVEPVGGKVGEVKTELTPAKVTDIPQLNKQLESIQAEPRALTPEIMTKQAPELQTSQTLRTLKGKDQSLDTIISEARKQIGTTPEPKDKSVKQVMDDLYTQWVDRYNPIVKASQQAKKTLKTQGAELRPEFDPEYLVRRLTGAGGIADYRFRTELNPIIKEMESLNIPKSDMDVYLANKRIAGFGKAGRDIYGADPKKAQEVVAAIESKYGNIQGLAQKFYDYQNKGFQEMVDAGFISPEAAKTIKSQNPDYAPLYRVMDEMDEYLGLPTRKTMQGTSPISKIKGSTRQIESPVESIIGNTFKQRAAIEKNRVAQSIVGLQNIADMGFTKASKASPETITVWNNGKKEYWNVGKDIAEVAKGQNEESMNTILKIIQAPAALLRQGATGRNPEFMIPNIIRDQLDAAITSKYGYIPFVDFVSGLVSMKAEGVNKLFGRQIVDPSIYKKWESSGAKIDLGELSGKKEISKLFDEKIQKRRLFSWLGDTLDFLGKYSEVPTRVGLFKKAYKKTGNELIAALESRDATVDFARMGTKMKTANSIIPFLNVGVQGFDKLIRSVKNNPGKVMINMAIYGATPAIMTTLYNLTNFPEEYAEIPQYEKDSNFIIVKGRNAKGTVDYLSVPKGNIIPVVANPATSFLEYLYGVDGQSFGQMATQLLSSTLPVVGDGSSMGEVALKTIGGNLPQAIKPAAEVLLNKSFYKYDPKREQAKEIVPQYLQKREPYQQFYEWTPKIYQKIGAVLNVSPLKVQNLMEGYLAGYVKIPANALDSLDKYSRGEELDSNEKFILRRFIKTTTPSSSKPAEKMPTTPLIERITGKAGAAEKAPEKITYTRKSDNSTQTIKLSDLQKPTGTTLKDYLSSGDRDSTIREIYKAYAKGEIDQSTMNKAFSGAGVSVREAENLVIATLPTEQKATLVYDRLVSPQSQLKDLEELVYSKLLTTAVIKEMKDTGKINDQQESALKNYLKQKSGKVSKGKKPKKFKPTKFKAIKLKGANKTYLKQKKLTLKDLLRK